MTVLLRLRPQKYSDREKGGLGGTGTHIALPCENQKCQQLPRRLRDTSYDLRKSPSASCVRVEYRYLKTLGKHKAENKPFVEVLFENVPPREDTDHEEDIQILGCNSVFPFRSYLRLPPLLTESMHSLRHFPLRKHALVCFSRYISDDGRIPRWRRYSDVVDPV